MGSGRSREQNAAEVASQSAKAVQLIAHLKFDHDGPVAKVGPKTWIKGNGAVQFLPGVFRCHKRLHPTKWVIGFGAGDWYRAEVTFTVQEPFPNCMACMSHSATSPSLCFGRGLGELPYLLPGICTLPDFRRRFPLSQTVSTKGMSD